ncbi:MAG: YihY/virulence factor BrkB family protein [Hyphomicrobiaceae bacterium]|nr:YihY/virulence factor BrkB family protein [Hyphomicrobiaceae bacterium]
MAAPARLNDRPRSPERGGFRRRLPGGVVVMAALIGLGRIFFGSRKDAPATGARQARQTTSGDAAGRGRDADGPAEIPARGWMDVGWRLYNEVQDDRVLLVAAGVTFYGLLALFPAIGALVSLYSLFADAATINQHFGLLAGFLPGGALEVIGDQVRRIAEQDQGKLGLGFLISLVLSLWGANAGTKSIFDALNIIYGEEEKRGFIKVTLWSLTFTAGAIALALIASASVVAVPIVLGLLGVSQGSGPGLLALMRWPLLGVLILLALACLYRFGPSRARPQWRWVTWGSAIAGAIWIAGSLAFSWYVANFGNYNATYGSLGAVIGFMIWMWLSTIVVLLGAEINSEMEHQTAKDTTEERGKPRGARGARMADEIGEARA